MKPFFRPSFSLPLCLLLLSFSSLSLAKRQLIDRSVITVNDDIILESDIAAFRKKAQSKNFQDLFGGLDPKKLENRDAVLQLLIEEKIIDQQVKKLELSASDQEVDRHIRSILERNGISEAQLKVRLRDLGTTLAEYKEGIKRQIERRNLVEREIKPTMEISDEELRHFMMRTGGGSGTDHRYHLAHILITTAGKKGEERARMVLKEALSKPEDFSKLAKEYSDDQATAETGGDLGMLSTAAMVKEFVGAAKATAPGTVYPEIVKTAGGRHIVKVVEREAVTFADVPEDRKAELRNQLAAQELERKMTLWMERKKGEAHLRRSESGT